MFLQYTKYRDIDAVTWHDACHVTKSPRLSLRFSLGRVKGQTWNYCAEGGRAWERGYPAPIVAVYNNYDNNNYYNYIIIMTDISYSIIIYIIMPPLSTRNF